MIGTIRLLKDSSYGFIHGEDGLDYFFHRTGLEIPTVTGGCTFDDLIEGQEVAFTPTAGPSGKGPRAIEVRRI